MIASWLADVEVAAVRASVEAAAPNRRQAGWLAAALDEGPGVLHGSTTAPPVIDRLVAQLAAFGVTTIAAPCCVRCGRSAWLTQRIDGHRACASCAHTMRGEPCSGCGQTRAVTTRTESGDAVCSVCLRKDASRWEPCSKCAKTRPVARRFDDGAGLCPTCTRRVVAVCSMCGNERVCTGIGSGNPRCQPCTARREPCSRCARTAKVSVVWATGPVCSTCRHKGLAAKVTCEGCGHRRRPDPRHPSGRCADCVGLPRFSVCTACGNEDRVYRAGRCIACTVPVVFDRLADGPVDLSALGATLTGSDRPRAVLRWLETPFITATITALAAGDIDLTHTGIDGLGDNLAVLRLRSVLVQSGLLDERDEALARLEAWITEHVNAITEVDQRRMIEAFATWHVLRRVRRRAERARVVNTKNARRQIHHAIEFLDHLHTHGTTLAECSQADLELFLAGPPGRGYLVEFVTWAHQRRLCVELTVPRRAQLWPAREISDRELRDLVARLLDDAELRTADRVAGLFVICYAQLPAHIARLRVDEVTIGADEVSVRFGTDDIVLPPRIGALVADLVATRRGRSATELGATSPWLFPGAIPGRPLDPETMRLRLTAIGIDNMRVRTATLLELAAQIPATVLADLVGLNPTTAARWNRAAGGDWASYAAIRATPRPR